MRVGPTVRKAIVMKTLPMRSTESAILGFVSPSKANQAIDSGVTWGSCHLSAEPFTRGVCAEQCFKCQEYCSHIARHCRKQTQCGWCAQHGHGIEACPTRGDCTHSRPVGYAEERKAIVQLIRAAQHVFGLRSEQRQSITLSL